MKNQEYIRTGATKYTTLGGYKAKLIVEQYTDASIIVKRVLVPKSESDIKAVLEECTILREGKSYYYIQQRLDIQNELITSIFQFLNK